MSQTKDGKLAAHFFVAKTRPACDAFHNATFHEPQNLSAEFVLSRLALTVIPSTINFNKLFGTVKDRKTKKRGRAVNDEQDGEQQSHRRNNQSNDTGASSGSEQLGSNTGNNAAGNDIIIDDERELSEDMKEAMDYYLDVFGFNASSSGSEDGQGPVSPKLPFARLDAVRAKIARCNVETLCGTREKDA
jgi:hypothetical protein